MLAIDNSKKWKDGQTYNEVGQANKSKFSFALVENDKVFPLHEEIKCRDFLNDTLVWRDEKIKGNESIYRYDYKGEIDTANTTLILTYCPLVEGNMGFLNDFEKELGIPPTEVIPVAGDGSTLVTRGSKWWMKTTIHLSWYTQTLRHLNYTLTKLTDESKEYLINDVHDRYWKLPFGLKKLKTFSIKRNAPTLCGMHDLNGFHTLLTIPQIRKQLTYGEQMTKVAPELFKE